MNIPQFTPDPLAATRLATIILATSFSVSYNGNTGLGRGECRDCLIEGCTALWNNYRRFHSGWHAGGMECILSNVRCTVRDCEAAYNVASDGIWFDYDNADIPALHAAASEPELFQLIRLSRMLVSWSNVVHCRLNEGQLAGVVHGALVHYDLPNLAAVLGEKLRIEEPRDALGRAVQPAK